MSDSQDAKNERRLQQRIQAMRAGGYSAIDEETLYRLAVDSPAGFSFGDSTALPWAPGTVLTPQQAQQVVSRIALPGHYVGGDGMTMEKYLSDPRSAIKVEGGQYVYRPEAAKGDFESIDRESLMESLGAFPFVLSAFAAPFAASLGVIGPGAGVMGSAEFPTFLGDAAGAASGAGGAASGLNAVNSFDTGAMGEILGTNVGDAAAGGINAVNSFDAGEMAKILGTDLTTAEKAVAAVKTAMSTPGGATSQVLSNAIKGVTGLEVSPGALQTIGKIAAVALTAGGGGGGGGGGSIGTTAATQSAAATDAMGLAREQWEWNKARAEELLPQQRELVQQQIDIGKLSAERAKSEWDTYQNLYLPAEQQYVQKMTNWDTPDRRTQRIQEAVADVNRGYDGAGGTLERNLARSGVRAGGDGYVQAMGDLTRARAADTAGAANTTRRQVENEGIAGLERVTNIGRGRPSTSFAADQLALTAGNSANANTNQNTATTNAGLSSAQGWFNTGVNALNSAGSMQNTQYKNEADSSAGYGKLLGQLFDWGFADGGLVRRGGRARQPMGYADGGLIRKAERKLQKHLGPMMRSGGYAEGGLVRGPGTETSDSIPAVIDGQEPTALSTGEAVLNAEAVQLVGEEFVERINQVGLERRSRPGRVIEGEARRVM